MEGGGRESLVLSLLGLMARSQRTTHTHTHARSRLPAAGCAVLPPWARRHACVLCCGAPMERRLPSPHTHVEVGPACRICSGSGYARAKCGRPTFSRVWAEYGWIRASVGRSLSNFGRIRPGCGPIRVVDWSLPDLGKHRPAFREFAHPSLKFKGELRGDPTRCLPRTRRVGSVDPRLRRSSAKRQNDCSSELVCKDYVQDEFRLKLGQRRSKQRTKTEKPILRRLRYHKTEALKSSRRPKP